MNKRLPQLLIHSCQSMVLVDLHDMLKSQRLFEVVMCTSPARAVLALQSRAFTAAIVDDTGEGPALCGLQQLFTTLQARNVPFICLFTSEDRSNLLLPDPSVQATVMLKPVHEAALRSAAAKLLAPG